VTILRVPFNIAFPGAGSPGANVWHIRTVTGPGGAELAEANTLIGYIRTFYDSVKSYLPSTTSISIGTVTEEITQREIVPTFANVGGTGTGSSPQALALVVTWRTSVAARRGRGRTFVGPLSTAASSSDGTPDNAVRLAVATAATALVTSSLAYGNGAIGVYGLEEQAPSNTTDYASLPHVLRDFQGSQVRDLFAVLRSRRD